MRPLLVASLLALPLLGCGHESTSSGDDTACSAKCAAEAAFACAAEASCVDTCTRTQRAGGRCGAELTAYAVCYGAHEAALSGCYTPDPCVAALGDYLVCADAECTTSACDHPDGTCTCEGTCVSRDVRSVCRGADCTCFAGGVEVGKCTDGSMPVCGLKESCCTGLYFLTK